jgi:hypothetical protein
MNATVAACCLLTVGLLPLSAQSPVPAPHTKPIFTTTRVDRPVRLTGQMDDPLWATSETIDLAYEFQPGENTQAPVRTEVKSVYDADNLYIAVRCYDPRPDEIRANYSDRDRVYSDDFIVVIFDTYGDYQRGYELVVNPYGIQGDLMMSSGGEDMSFDMIWESAGSITSDGWIAEMAIPFKSLRFPDKDVQEWGFNVSRTYPRTSRTQARSRDCATSALAGRLNCCRTFSGSSRAFAAIPPIRGRRSPTATCWAASGRAFGMRPAPTSRRTS